MGNEKRAEKLAMDGVELLWFVALWSEDQDILQFGRVLRCGRDDVYCSELLQKQPWQIVVSDVVNKTGKSHGNDNIPLRAEGKVKKLRKSNWMTSTRNHINYCHNVQESWRSFTAFKSTQR